MPASRTAETIVSRIQFKPTGVKRIAGKPANGEINLSLAHQPAVMNNPGQQARKH
jgi:hypothetical protein